MICNSPSSVSTRQTRKPVGIGMLLGMDDPADGKISQPLGGVFDPLDLKPQIGQGLGDFRDRGLGVEMVFEPGDREFHKPSSAGRSHVQCALADKAERGKPRPREQLKFNPRGIKAEGCRAIARPPARAGDLEESRNAQRSHVSGWYKVPLTIVASPPRGLAIARFADRSLGRFHATYTHKQFAVLRANYLLPTFARSQREYRLPEQNLLLPHELRQEDHTQYSLSIR